MRLASFGVVLFVVAVVGCGDSPSTSPGALENSALAQNGPAVDTPSPASAAPAENQASGRVPAAQEPAEASSALAVFKQRIVPIMKSSNPSSCAECHLSGVDLKQYIREDQAQTFAALRDSGLIDVNDPASSKLLGLINRRPEKPSLVTEKIRQAEYDAFKAWIEAAVKDPQLAAAATADDAIGSPLPPEVIRHARQDRVLASFIDNVWSEVGRCAACHSPDRNKKQVAEHGAKVSWIKLGDPQATLDYMVDAGLIDTDNPEDSLLLAKPTLQVKHGGGQKLMIGDRTYTQFRRFIEDYAATLAGEYRSADELPAAPDEVSNVTDVWLKLNNVPQAFDGKLLRVNIYRWDEAAGAWSADRWATGDRAVAGDRRLWQQHLSLTAPRSKPRAAELPRMNRLPPGKYLLKLYVDREGRAEKQYPYELGEQEFVGQVEIRTDWKTGYGAMTVARYPGN